MYCDIRSKIFYTNNNLLYRRNFASYESGKVEYDTITIREVYELTRTKK